jgi:hypothetical protein
MAIPITAATAIEPTSVTASPITVGSLAKPSQCAMK